MIPTATINIASHLAVMAGRQPDIPAIMEPGGRDRSGAIKYNCYTYNHLNRRSDEIGRGFNNIGIELGSRVAVCQRPGFDFFSVAFALFKIGAVPVLIDPGIGIRNFGRCLAEAEPMAFVGIPLAHLLRRTFRWARKTLRINITTGHFGGQPLRDVQRMGFAPHGGTGFQPVLAAHTQQTTSNQGLHTTSPPTRAGSPYHDEGSNPAAILFTSGSTGPPKGVLYTHANFDAQVRALRDLYNIQPGEIDLATFPLFGLFGPALGMTTVIPQMDFTRPGQVDPRHIIEPIQQLNITNLFGSPALLDRVGSSMAANDLKLPSLRRVISAGAPVPAKVLERFASMLSPGVRIFTPYGATESLPVCSIGSDEILRETRQLTDSGKGICVGRPAGSMRVLVIPITDEPITLWSDDLPLAANQIGEIIVQGPVVTSAYFNRPTATQLAKITDPSGGFFHRMGDVGYLDDVGRLWFCGRKSQRVKTPAGDLFSIPFEAVFNTHPAVARSALVGVNRDGVIEPVICIERAPKSQISTLKLLAELHELSQKHDHTSTIKHFLFHPRFPVDIRHNAKIGREKLTIWAARKLP